METPQHLTKPSQCPQLAPAARGSAVPERAPRVRGQCPPGPLPQAGPVPHPRGRAGPAPSGWAPPGPGWSHAGSEAPGAGRAERRSPGRAAPGPAAAIGLSRGGGGAGVNGEPQRGDGSASPLSTWRSTDSCLSSRFRRGLAEKTERGREM